MINDIRLIRILKGISIGLLTPILLTLLINLIDYHIEFSNPYFNRFWGFFICYLVIGLYLITLLIIKSYHKILRWIIIIGILPVAYFTVGILILQYGKADEQRYDRYIAYRDIDKKNKIIVIQDYINWKHNSPRVDTSLIHDYWMLRHINHLDSFNVSGTWIKYSEKGEIIDTIRIK